MPSTRRTDPDTSHLAEASVREVNRKQAAVLECFKQHGRMTDNDLLVVYRLMDLEPQSDSGLRTRRRELTDKKLIKAVGRTTNEAGRRVLVWGLNEAHPIPGTQESLL